MSAPVSVGPGATAVAVSTTLVGIDPRWVLEATVVPNRFLTHNPDTEFDLANLVTGLDLALVRRVKSASEIPLALAVLLTTLEAGPAGAAFDQLLATPMGGREEVLRRLAGETSFRLRDWLPEDSLEAETTEERFEPGDFSTFLDTATFKELIVVKESPAKDMSLAAIQLRGQERAGSDAAKVAGTVLTTGTGAVLVASAKLGLIVLIPGGGFVVLMAGVGVGLTLLAHRLSHVASKSS